MEASTKVERRRFKSRRRVTARLKAELNAFRKFEASNPMIANRQKP
jgi:hypothetical protein